MATIDGSETTMPRPRANTSVFAVPRSIAKSLEKRLKIERRFIETDLRTSLDRSSLLRKIRITICSDRSPFAYRRPRCLWRRLMCRSFAKNSKQRLTDTQHCGCDHEFDLSPRTAPSISQKER